MDRSLRLRRRCLSQVSLGWRVGDHEMMGISTVPSGKHTKSY